ncbi:hypothetical protein BG015_009490 [Linnemannia schmuckeri]|uniref:C2H2-type domain-containing protein n=1 Tax=Linnemannia schmuckeri TaxID=64567 RepID=A0A9P5RZ01_9FUNG|nr:hypothetical protein BG015_009490 [Linnemannia schmuckeri]
MSDRFSELGFPLSSNPPSPSLSPTLSSAHIDSFNTWQEVTCSRHLLTPLELQTMDTDDAHYSSGNGSGYESDMFTAPQEMPNSQGMLQVPARPHEMSSLNARCSFYPGSPSPQPQPLHPLDASLAGTPMAGTPLAGSPSPQHIDAAQFRVLMNEATNRIKALAEVDYVSPSQSSFLATNVEFLSPNNPSTFATYAHNVPRVYLRRSHSVESLVAEPASTWTTAEQIGQVNSAQFVYQQQQQQQHLQYLELQHQRSQQHQMVDYPTASAATIVPSGNVHHMNQLSMNMVQMHMGLMNGSNTYDPIAIVDNHLSQVSSPMPMVKTIRNKRPLSACSYSSVASSSFSSPSTASPSPILHSTTLASLVSSSNTPDRKRHTRFPNIKTDITFITPSHSTLSASSSTSNIMLPRLQSPSLQKTRPKSLPNKVKNVNNKDGNLSNNTNNVKLKSTHKPPVNRFVCPLPGCGRTFSRPFNLKSHGMTHETLRPYGCDKCSKTFARIHDRDRHLKGHLDEKAHFCVVCQGKFARQDAVTRHLKLAKEKNPCAVILKENGASFRDAAAGRVIRSQLGDEGALRRRFQQLENDAKKIKATKTLEKGMLSIHLLTMNHRTALNIPQQKQQQLQQQLQTPMSSASQSPSTPLPYSAGTSEVE